MPLKLFRLIVLAVFINYVTSVLPGPKYRPTSGEVWPKPQLETKKKVYYTFNPSEFEVKITNFKCPILDNAVKRYSYVFRDLYTISEKYKPKQNRSLLCPHNLSEPDENYQGDFYELYIKLTTACEEDPYFGMDESYNLTISRIAQLTSASLWGVLRGLETLAHLFYFTDDFKEMRINGTQIVDFPRYAHRGLLIDTSRHYISVTNILTILDGMAMNKLNVLHWHIVDDQSFPYQSEILPELSNRGAYHSSMVYSKNDIQTIIEYARNRGIRVLPEFDVPGHTRSWGEAYPNILTKCYKHDQEIGLGPMDPTNNMTYKLLKTLFDEVKEWFPDNFFHVGGDEVDLSCWESNPNILDYMEKNNISNVKKLHGIFMEKIIPLLANKTPIVWQEVFQEKVPLTANTLVHVWKSEDDLLQVLQANKQVVYSASWYLEYQQNQFTEFFLADPRQFIINQTGGNTSLADDIVGGEACMWAEMVDDRNALTRIFPLTSAVAERLWSPALARNYRFLFALDKVYHRIEEHVCRMIRRRIPAKPPKGPGFCLN